MKRIGISLVAAGFALAAASAASAQSTRGTTNSTIGSGTATGTTGMEHSTANRAATTGSTTHGASAMAPGHLKKTAKKPTTSAKTFAPGQRGNMPGQQ